jgi:predicted RNA polymerase sigma factor
MAYGPRAGLNLVDELATVRSMQEYHLLPSVRGDLLVKLGRPGEVRREFERAAALTGNERECALLLARAAECAAGSR